MILQTGWTLWITLSLFLSLSTYTQSHIVHITYKQSINGQQLDINHWNRIERTWGRWYLSYQIKKPDSSLPNVFRILLIFTMYARKCGFFGCAASRFVGTLTRDHYGLMSCDVFLLLLDIMITNLFKILMRFQLSVCLSVVFLWRTQTPSFSASALSFYRATSAYVCVCSLVVINR